VEYNNKDIKELFENWLKTLSVQKPNLTELVRWYFSDSAEQTYIKFDEGKRNLIDKVLQDIIDDPNNYKNYKHIFYPKGAGDYEVVIIVDSIKIKFSVTKSKVEIKDIEE